jgi:adenine-specific DNA-methyltransferase
VSKLKIWSIENLKDEGELVYIVPFNWFNSTFAESLRNYLVRNGYFEAIIHFGEYKLFEDCSPNSIIFKYRKSKNKIKPSYSFN